VPIVASAQQTIGIVVALVVVVGWALYLLANVRKSRREVGSELELAPNREPYLNDDQLEGPRLDRALTWGLVTLTIVGVGLPLYWLQEPDRQAGAVENFEERFSGESRLHGSEPIGGGALFATTEAGGFNCAGCHGGMGATGGVAPYTLSEPVLDPQGNPVLDESGQPRTTLRQVQWAAPALNTVLLRYGEDEVRFVLTYGRPFSPMPAWGTEGGGPMNEQQLDNLIRYLRTIQISPEEARQQAAEDAQAELQRLQQSGGPQPATLGAALFNGNCARCHTKGWSYGEPAVPGGGGFGPNLTNGTTVRQFPSREDHVEFVTNSVEEGEQYGVQGQMDGGAQMPAFGQVLTPEQIQAIVDYERSL
jgi:mono/diheme cytochrome c family protein